MNSTTISSMNDRIRDAVNSIVQGELDSLKARGRRVVKIESPHRGDVGEVFWVGEYVTAQGSYDVGRKFMIPIDKASERERPHPFATATPGDLLRWRSGGNTYHSYLFHGRFELVGTYSDLDWHSIGILAQVD